MEITAPVIVAIVIGIGLPLIGLIVWLVHGEGRTNTNAKDIADLKIEHNIEIAALKKDHADDIRELKEDLKDTRERFFKHASDLMLHHNAEATLEFRTALERRFTGMENSLQDITRKLNHMAGRE